MQNIDNEESLLELTERKDEEGIDNWMKKAKAGKIVRIT